MQEVPAAAQGLLHSRAGHEREAGQLAERDPRSALGDEASLVPVLDAAREAAGAGCRPASLWLQAGPLDRQVGQAAGQECLVVGLAQRQPAQQSRVDVVQGVGVRPLRLGAGPRRQVGSAGRRGPAA